MLSVCIQVYHAIFAHSGCVCMADFLRYIMSVLTFNWVTSIESQFTVQLRCFNLILNRRTLTSIWQK